MFGSKIPKLYYQTWSDYEANLLSQMPKGDLPPPSEDVVAFAHYSLLGLNPLSMAQNFTVDARAIMFFTGLSFAPSAGIAIIGGMLVAGALGWAVDPAHKHDFGWDEYSSYPGNWDWESIDDRARQWG